MSKKVVAKLECSPDWSNDITMCSNEDCPLKKKCYRHEATPNPYWQSYSDFQPIGNTCDGFWEI